MKCLVFPRFLHVLTVRWLFSPVAHTDYRGPPVGYRPMEPMARPEVEFDYLTPNDALPYPPAENRTSEAKVISHASSDHDTLAVK